MSDYIIHNGTLMSAELYHHGVKGMKWGVRRVKKYKAKADMYRSFAKDYDPDDYIGSKPLTAKERTKMNQKVSENLAKAKKYDEKAARAENGSAVNRDNKAKQKMPSKKTKAAIAKTVTKGAEVAGKLMLASAADDIFYGGAGKKIAKEAVIQTGRAAVTAYTMARGGYDIKWYDKSGRRVG